MVSNHFPHNEIGIKDLSFHIYIYIFLVWSHPYLLDGDGKYIFPQNLGVNDAD